MLKVEDDFNDNREINNDNLIDKDQNNNRNGNVRRYTSMRNNNDNLNNVNNESFPFTGILDIVAENGYGFLRVD